MRRPKSRGAALAVALITLMVVMLMTGAILQSLLASRRQLLLGENELQAAWLAESGLQRAASQLRSQADYDGEAWSVSGLQDEPNGAQGLVKIEVTSRAAEPMTKRITATATYPLGSPRQIAIQRVLEVRIGKVQPEAEN